MSLMGGTKKAFDFTMIGVCSRPKRDFPVDGWKQGIKGGESDDILCFDRNRSARQAQLAIFSFCEDCMQRGSGGAGNFCTPPRTAAAAAHSR